jgi:hypothetical protein
MSGVRRQSNRPANAVRRALDENARGEIMLGHNRKMSGAECLSATLAPWHVNVCLPV